MIIKPLCYLLFLSATVLAQDPYPPLVVPARQLPVPNTVSAELQKVLARPVSPPSSSPTTAEGWRELQRRADANMEKTVRTVATMVGVKIEPTTIAGVSCFHVTPKQIAPENENRLIVHIHGGAFVYNAGIAATGEGVLLANATKTRVLSIDYRMPPDHPFPAAPDDVLAVWKEVVKNHDPKRIAMAGTSAGGGLILTTMLRLKEQKLPMPAVLFVGTPGADLTKTGDSLFANAEIDHGLGRYEGRIEACLKLYANGRDLKDSQLSPVYGDLSGLPPTILISGTRDLLLSPTIRVHRKLRTANVPAELHVYEGQSHADYLGSFPAPESHDALREIALFFEKHLQK